MFQNACATVRESVYGIVTRTRSKQGKRTRIRATNGSGFMISPGIIATAAHITHVDGNKNNPHHQEFLVIRAPEIGAQFEDAKFIVEDTTRDVALLEIERPRSTKSVTLEPKIVLRGTSCGSLGFPLAEIKFKKSAMTYHAYERFLGGHISNYIRTTQPYELFWYETDYVMYGGSSGCPGFTTNGNVIGLQSGTVPLRKKQIRTSESSRIAICRMVPSVDIINFVKINKIKI